MHADLIDALGGAQVVADACGVSRTAAANWRTRPYGVADEHRMTVAQLAHERGVSLPSGFLDELARRTRCTPEELMARITSPNAGAAA